METLTSKIFELSAPYDNPYQGTEQRLLFVCSAGLLRSATAANIYAARGFNTRAAGSSPYALVPLSRNLIAWADKIIFVNKENYEEALETFKDEYYVDVLKQATVLNIPDIYPYKDYRLISELDKQLDEYLSNKA
jgi:predicted protein tyrosine phosphatase